MISTLNEFFCAHNNLSTVRARYKALVLFNGVALAVPFRPKRIFSSSQIASKLLYFIWKVRLCTTEVYVTIPSFTFPSFMICARIDEMDICGQDPFSREKSFSTIIQFLAFYKHHLLQVFFFRFKHRIAVIYHWDAVIWCAVVPCECLFWQFTTKAFSSKYQFENEMKAGLRNVFKKKY